MTKLLRTYRHSLRTLALAISCTLPLITNALAPVEDRSVNAGSYLNQQSQQKMVTGDDGSDVRSVNGNNNTGADEKPLISSDSQEDRSFEIVRDPPSSAVNDDGTSSAIHSSDNNSKTIAPADDVDDLQQQVATLKGQVEAQKNEITRLQQLQRQAAIAKLKQDGAEPAATTPPSAVQYGPSAKTTNAPASKSQATIAKPITKAAIPTAAPIAAVTPAAPVDTAPPPAAVEDTLVYNAAYEELKAKNYTQATNDLTNFVKQFPKSPHLASAHYWLGELHLLSGEVDQAESEFKIVTTDFDSSPKSADAFVKLGLLYYNQNKWQDAKNAFREVVARFPGSAQAEFCETRLKQMIAEGR